MHFLFHHTVLHTVLTHTHTHTHTHAHCAYKFLHCGKAAICYTINALSFAFHRWQGKEKNNWSHEKESYEDLNDRFDITNNAKARKSNNGSTSKKCNSQKLEDAQIDYQSSLSHTHSLSLSISHWLTHSHTQSLKVNFAINFMNWVCFLSSTDTIT